MPTGALGGVVSVGRACPRGVEPEPEYQAFPDVARRNAWQERVEVPVLTSALGLPRGGRVLEVGCGRGVALPALAERLRPARLVGLDVERALLAEAAARLRERRCAAELVEADVRDMPFPDSSFDLVIDFGTCYHVARPHQALREVGRVLAAGGRFVHETRVSQILSHPVRARRKRLPWHAAPGLEAGRHALLWAVRTKVGAVVALVVALALSASAAVARAQEAPTSPPAPVPAPVVSTPRTDPPGTGPSRLFFAPTARSMPRGAGDLGLTEIAFPWAEGSLGGRVSVLGVLVPPLGTAGAGIVVGPKVQLVRQRRFQAAAGVIQALGGGETGGIGYAVVTVGTAGTALTLGYGYAYGGWIDPGESAGVVFTGAEKSLGPTFRLVFEGYFGGQGLGLPQQTLIGAVRIAKGRWSVDLGVLVPGYESGTGSPFPLVTIARRF